MKKIYPFLLSLLLLFSGVAWASNVIPGKVIAISDGDTITLLTPEKQQLKIRLVGIDAPEKKQAYGTKARDHLAAHVFRQAVEVDIRKKDQYGRSLGVVYLGDNDINQLMIRDGYAWFYKHYAKEQPKEEALRYADSEREARTQGKGLWADPHPVPPWEFRKASKQDARATKVNRNP